MKKKNICFEGEEQQFKKDEIGYVVEMKRRKYHIVLNDQSTNIIIPEELNLSVGELFYVRTIYFFIID